MAIQEKSVEDATYEILGAAQANNWEIHWFPRTMSGPGAIQVNNNVIGNSDELVLAAIEAADRMLNERKWIRHSAGILYKVTDAGRQALFATQQSQQMRQPESQESITIPDEFATKVFIVHGQSDKEKYAATHVIHQLGLEPIILHEQPNGGRTIIEKLEAHSNVGFAVVLLTADDVGYSTKDGPEKAKPRARQNVVMELGFFMAKINRGKICVLYGEDVELPSDFQGIVYIPLDPAGAWKFQLGKELKNAGFTVDVSKIAP